MKTHTPRVPKLSKNLKEKTRCIMTVSNLPKDQRNSKMLQSIKNRLFIKTKNLKITEH